MKKNNENNNQKGRNYVNILGINVISTTLTEVLAGVKEKIADSSRFYILTPNPEIVLMAQKNAELKEALNSADFAIPDGTGLAYASRFLYGRSLNIIHGRILFAELIKLAAKNHWKVFLLGGLDNEAELAARELRIRNQELRIEAAKGSKLKKGGEPVSEVDRNAEKDAIDRVNKFAPQLLFVAFGNPKQEIWIHKNLSKLEVGGAMAVGGAFRYTAGLSKLPPKWMENMGLEWLYRLITEPYRLGRVINAFPIFPLKVFWYKLTHL